MTEPGSASDHGNEAKGSVNRGNDTFTKGAGEITRDGQATLVDIDGLAEWLATSARHVRRLVAERRIPYVKVGHFVRFDRDDIAAWIEDQKVGAETLPAGVQPPWVRQPGGSMGGTQLVAPRDSSRQAPSPPRSTPPWQTARSG